MRTRSKLIGALAVAGVVAASGTAFTAANTGFTANEFVGYGSTTVTGVTVSNVAYNVNGTDASLLDTIVFTVAQDVTGAGYESLLTINGATGTRTTCTATFTTVGTITCPTTAAIATVTSVGLTVTAK